MRLYLNFILIYLISHSKWILVESGDTSTSTPVTSPKTNAAESGNGSTTTPLTSGGNSSTVKTGQDGTGTTAGESVKKTAFELDIKKDSGTKEFDYKKDNKIATFTAKDNYAFNVVKQDKTEIWKAEDDKGYSNMVVLNGKGQKKKTVTIHLPNNTTKVFNRVGKGKPWSEINENNKGTETMAGDGSTFEININSTDSRKYFKNFTLEDWSGIKLYTIKNGKNCSKVKFGDKEIWKYENGDYPQKVRYESNDNKIFIYFKNDATKTYKKNNQKWEEQTEGSNEGGDANENKTSSDNQSSGGATTPASQPSGGTNGTGASGGGTTPASTPAS